MLTIEQKQICTSSTWRHSLLSWPAWPDLSTLKSLANFQGLFSNGKNFEPYFYKFVYYRNIFLGCKWPNIKKILPSGRTGRGHSAMPFVLFFYMGRDQHLGLAKASLNLPAPPVLDSDDKWQELFGCKILCFTSSSEDEPTLKTDLHDFQTCFHSIDLSADRRLVWNTNHLQIYLSLLIQFWSIFYLHMLQKISLNFWAWFNIFFKLFAELFTCYTRES